jgi:lysophospholipase L1-like esterase
VLKSLFQRKNARHFQRYVALGDSISTDDYPGEGKGAASLLYRNQDHLYPAFRGKDLLAFNHDVEFLSLARDGASSYDVLHDQLPQLGKGSRGRTLFTLTCGGNDILSHQAEPDEVMFRIGAVLDRLQQLFPNGEIVIGTIYDPTDGEGDLFEHEILEKELKMAHAINERIRRLSQPPQIRVAEIHHHFLGHGLHSKDPSNPYFHPEDPSLWYVLAIEPNSQGAHEIRKLFWKAIAPESSRDS